MATHRETGKRKTALVRHLREELGSGALAPGELLPPVRQLAEQFGLSRRSVHDELLTLSAEGWLETVPRVGIYVREMQPAPSQTATLPTSRFLEHAVVVVTPSERPHPGHLQSGWLDHVSAGALREIHRRALHGVVLHPERFSEESVAHLALENPLGAIIPETDDAPGFARMLRAQGVRVIVGGDAPEFATFDRVTSDHAHGTHLLTRWLIEQGRRRVGMLWTVNPNTYWSRARRRGYEAAMYEAGLKPLPLLNVSAAAFTLPRAELIEACARELHSLFEPTDGTPPLDALLVPSDGYVSEADEACRMLGKIPGRDLLIAGYDNHWQDLEACGHPFARPVATVDKRHQEMGATMVELLLARAKGEANEKGERRVITPLLVPVK